MLMIKNHLTRSKFLQSAILRHLPFQWGIILSDVNKISNALHSTNLVQQDSSCYYSLLCTKKFNISLYFEICVLKPKVGLSYKNLTLFTGIGSISMTDQSDDEFDHDDLVERKVGIERCQVIALTLRQFKIGCLVVLIKLSVLLIYTINQWCIFLSLQWNIHLIVDQDAFLSRSLQQEDIPGHKRLYRGLRRDLGDQLARKYLLNKMKMMMMMKVMTRVIALRRMMMRKMHMELHWRGMTINLTKIKMRNFISSLKAVFRKECTLWVYFFLEF